ncbi:zinc finger CCHC domain-containing protein 24-like [Amphibalanus amphitrite]|uniref:zinc finger CCHC domain-containing protein 24-like n=1 Tax=Amphibalanus amphitrite TaxID=1232801 RepID=UPI001C91B801|nr:zinc finger CCHC domain-containing protein 24-like [Amphibalanus amphitrite]XP_043229906.1 zinc finger CCHC domain-containing protein 24-like [Amphibalanus amphitrite]
MSDSSEYDSDDLAEDFEGLAVDNPPPRKYKCGVCKEVGDHFINDCPTAAETGQRTPYQGKRRCFGQYQCSSCLRLWVSSRSWANTQQACQDCKVYVYPHRQRSLYKPQGMDDVCDLDKNHQQQLCGRCHRLGHSCVQ